jgi:hypothetical protein
MSDRSRVMTQTKRDTLVLQVGGFGVGLTTPHSKNVLLRKLNKGKRRILFDRPKPTAGCSANGRRRRIICILIDPMLL